MARLSHSHFLPEFSWFLNGTALAQVAGTMLRISRSQRSQGPHLRLEGRLVGEWVHVLAKELGTSERLDSVSLDLSAVEFANEAGVRVLLAARERGAVFEACSPILASLLEERAP